MLQESAAHAADINKHAATQAVVEDIGSVLRQSTSHKQRVIDRRTFI